MSFVCADCLCAVLAERHDGRVGKKRKKDSDVALIYLYVNIESGSSSGQMMTIFPLSSCYCRSFPSHPVTIHEEL